jgi:hypothetical protein
MVFSVRSAGGLCLGLAFSASLTLAQAGSSPHAAAPQALLPSSFAGWSAAAPPQTGDDPATIDAPNTSVLKEYGLKDFATGEYRHGGGRLAIRAMHFVDATGAYGAFTFYRRPDMHPADIGKGAAADAREVTFWSGTTLVDATSDHIGPEERSALKALAAALPQNGGPEGVPPSLPQYLPTESLDKSTVHYAIGPDAYTKAGGVLPPELIDFSRDAEAVTAEYPYRPGKGTLTILEYPTPQMAAERAKAIDAVLKGSSLPAGLQHGNPAALSVKRSGPLVAVTSGDLSGEEAGALLGKVKYEASLTVNQAPNGYVGEVKKTARLLLGILYLTGILGASALLVGLFLGGGRALIRVLRGKPPSTMNDDDFISLKLGR